MKDCEQIIWPSADELRPFMGQWVAVRDAEVRFFGGTLHDLTAKIRDWLFAYSPSATMEDYVFLYVPTAEQHRHAR